MILNDFSHFDPGAGAPPARERETAWRMLPVEGPLGIVYEDARGAWSSRLLDARELKLGPGRTLLCGIDRRHGLYRALRADRIRRLTDPATGQRIETGILDWLLARAEAQRRAHAARERAGKARERAASRAGVARRPRAAA